MQYVYGSIFTNTFGGEAITQLAEHLPGKHKVWG